MQDVEIILRQFLLPIGAAFFIAWVVHIFSGRIAGRFINLSDYAPESMRFRHERQLTLRDLLSSMISFLAFTVAIVFTLGLFVDTTTLIWIIGLFSAAFGLGARPVISDYLTGMSFIFEDVFDVGEKIEVSGVEGVIEKISLRTITIRAATGEPYTVPNGEIRVVRNFSRGRFSTADITIKLDSADLDKAITLLENMAEEAVTLLPNLLEPWQVMNTSGVMSQQAELTLTTKTRFGKAAELRLRMLPLIQERLTEAEIRLVA